MKTNVGEFYCDTKIGNRIRNISRSRNDFYFYVSWELTGNT